MRATPYYYNGDELGMTNIKFDTIDDYQDIETRNWYQTRKNVRRRRTRNSSKAPKYSPRQQPHAISVGRNRQRRLHHWQAVAESESKLQDRQRRRRKIKIQTAA